jgi:hypothetical protein
MVLSKKRKSESAFLASECCSSHFFHFFLLFFNFDVDIGPLPIAFRERMRTLIQAAARLAAISERRWSLWAEVTWPARGFCAEMCLQTVKLDNCSLE